MFSLATPVHSNNFLIFWDGTNKEIEPHIKDRKAEFGGRDYKPNMWHSICTTWDSESGLVQIWFNGLPSIRKFVNTGTNIVGPVIIILGQVHVLLINYKYLFRFSQTLYILIMYYMYYNIQCSFNLLYLKHCILYRSKIPTVADLTLSSLSLAWCLTSTCGITSFPPVKFKTMWMNWTSRQGMCWTGAHWNLRS